MSVNLTCHKVTSTADIVKKYIWYKNGKTVTGEVLKVLNIGTNRTGSANYSCKVVTEDNRTSDESDTKMITFKCKYNHNQFCILLLSSDINHPFLKWSHFVTRSIKIM